MVRGSIIKQTVLIEENKNGNRSKTGGLSVLWCHFCLQGRFEIISLSGSFLLSENNGNRSRTGGLSVSLAGSDGRVLGGGVAGMLMAASPVQVLLVLFMKL